jgi:lysophospholipase
MSDAAQSPDRTKSGAPAESIFAPRFITAKSGHRLRVGIFDSTDSTVAQDVCVLLNGQTEFIEKYFEVIDELRARGFSVVTLDWRGQGGSERLLPDSLKAHVNAFSAYDDDLGTLLDEVVSPMCKRPPIGLAHSMGGHNLLRTLQKRPSAFRRVALSAPMIAVSARGTPAWLAKSATAFQNLRGGSAAWVWGMDQRDPLKMGFSDQLVTSDQNRFQRSQDFLSANPSTRLAGPTWGWLGAAYRSMGEMNARGYPESISTPVLIFGAGRDRICLTPAAKSFCARLPKGRYVELEDAEHEILMENDGIRQRFWREFDAFTTEEA